MENTANLFCIYDDFIHDMTSDDSIPCIKYPNEYNHETVIKLVVSQHGYFISDKQQKQITEDWIKFLSNNQLPLKKVQICSNMNQKVFNALCNQESIEALIIKWFKGKEVSKIENLKNLKELYFERASSLESIAPISKLENLEQLILCNTFKVADYSCLEHLKKLKVLGICKARISHDNKKIKAYSLDFIQRMKALEYVDTQDVEVANEI